MADLSGFTYTEIEPARNTDSGYRRRRFVLSTASGEYPTGGIPLDNDSLGCPNDLRALHILEEEASAIDTYKWDRSANTIKVFQESGSGALAEHANATFTSPDQLIIEVEGW